MALWFKHDNSALLDQKILSLRYECGMEGYGIYWALLETMHQDPTGYIDRRAIGGLSIGYGVTIETLNKAIENMLKSGLLSECEHGKLYNKRMIEQKSSLSKLAENGAKGANKRWKNSQAIATPLPDHSHPNADRDRDRDRDRESKSKPKKKIAHSFSDSPYNDIKKLTEKTGWEEAKAKHYWDKMSFGSEAKGYKYLDWSLVAVQWAKKDDNEGKGFVVASGNTLTPRCTL